METEFISELIYYVGLYESHDQFMGLESFVKVLYVPEDALKLRQGKIRVQNLKEYSLNESDILEAAEILIEINDAYLFFSQADVVERAISYGWAPNVENSLSICDTELFIESNNFLTVRKNGTPISKKFLRKSKYLIFHPLYLIKRTLLRVFNINFY